MGILRKVCEGSREETLCIAPKRGGVCVAVRIPRGQKGLWHVGGAHPTSPAHSLGVHCA